MANPNPPRRENFPSKTGGPGRPKGSKNHLTRERLELEIKRLALSNIIEAFSAVHGNRRTFTLREIRQMPEDMQRCIATVKVRTENLKAGDGEQDQTIEIRLWDKTRALELAARTLGMLKDRLEVTTSEDLLAKLDMAKLRARKPTTE